MALALVASACPAARPDRGQTRETLPEPPVVESRVGVLNLTLNAALRTVGVAGQRAQLMSYNGTFLPPTLRVHPGDVIRIRLVNGLSQVTNLHTHGLEVSPLGTSDNVFLHVQPRHVQDYEIRIPADHPSGLNWYHPHAHTNSDQEVRDGMSGALIVDGLLAPFPTLRTVRERVLLLKDVQLVNGRAADVGIGKDETRTVNGVVNPTLVLRPGETELWRIANVSADLYYVLVLDGHPFHVVARDGQLLARTELTDTLVITPSGRAEVLVQGGAAGVHLLRTANVNTGPAGNQYASTVMATVVVEGAPATPVAIPAALHPMEDFRGKVTNRRTILFTESADSFYINGKTFDMHRVDTRVRLGAVEEWTVRNQADELHSFHIHQTHFQVTEINGVPQPLTGYRDVIDVPIGGEVKVIIPFTDPVIVGKFAYHCHILSHEDKGMMATIVVAP